MVSLRVGESVVTASLHFCDRDGAAVDKLSLCVGSKILEAQRRALAQEAPQKETA